MEKNWRRSFLRTLNISNYYTLNFDFEWSYAYGLRAFALSYSFPDNAFDLFYRTHLWIFFEGRDLLKASPQEMIEIRRHKMGMVFQHFALLHQKTQASSRHGKVQIVAAVTQNGLGEDMTFGFVPG